MLVSVIIPVYNVEKYLEKCIDSILAQTLTDFELILVNDGSTDKSRDICDKYAQTDRRVKVIHKQNGGVSSARNEGIEKADGKYVTFIDSDDCILPDYLQQLLSLESDLSICGNISMSDMKELSRKIPEEEFFCDRDTIDYANLYAQNLMYMPWGKMFRRDIIMKQNLRFFSNISIGEDSMFVADYLKYVNTVSVHNYAGYIYNSYEDYTSLSSKVSYDVLDMLTLSRDHVLKIMEDVSKPALLEIKRNTLSNAAWYTELLINSNMPFKKKKAFLQHYLENKYVKETLETPEVYYSSKKALDCLSCGSSKNIIDKFTKYYRAERKKSIKRKIYNFIKR